MNINFLLSGMQASALTNSHNDSMSTYLVYIYIYIYIYIYTVYIYIINHAKYTQLSAIPEFDYLSRIIFRLYENKKLDEGHPAKFRLEIGVRYSFVPCALV